MLRLLGLLLLVAAAHAAEYAVLDNGFRLRVERHQSSGDKMRLFTENGEIELPAESVVTFEREEDVPASQSAEVRAQAAKSLSPRELIDRAAERYGLPAGLLHSVAGVESAYRQDAVSPKGAIGIMQLMPSTAAELNADPTDPEQNVDAAARHLRDLLLKYDGGVYRALAAYNAGAGAVQKYGWIPPYRETQLYVQRVWKRFQRLNNPRLSADY